ncbi:MAG: GNAT family N-acetyltransferase [Bacteroidales bacterium]|nr:GNAT family N-acetyltransferase [Bacteroidales bacterium]
MWRFDICRSWDEIASEGYREAWAELMARSSVAHPFFHPALVDAWLETYRPLRHLEPLFVHATDGASEAFLPLVLWRRNWRNGFVRLLIPVGYSDFDYHDAAFVGEQADFYPALLDQLRRLPFDRIELPGLHDTIPHLTRTEERCPLLELSPFADLEHYLAQCPHKLTADTKRQQRRLEQHGTVQVRKFSTQTSAAWEPSLEALLRCFRQHWPQAYIAPHLHRNLLRRGMDSGLADVVTTAVDGNDVAWAFLFHHRQTTFYYLPASDPSFQNFSVGRLTLMACIGQAFERGDQRFDFLRGDEAYKQQWTTSTQTIYNHLCVGQRPASVVRNRLYTLRRR